jgi:hypothetical protein
MALFERNPKKSPGPGADKKARSGAGESAKKRASDPKARAASDKTKAVPAAAEREKPLPESGALRKKSASGPRQPSAAGAASSESARGHSGITTEAKARTERTSVRMPTKQLGELLVKSGDITEVQLTKALKYQKKHGGLIGQILRKMNACEKQAIAGALRKQFRIADIDLGQVELEVDVLPLLPREKAIEHGALPFEKLGSMLCLAMKNCLNRRAIKEIEDITDCKAKPLLRSACGRRTRKRGGGRTPRYERGGRRSRGSRRGRRP